MKRTGIIAAVCSAALALTLCGCSAANFKQGEEDMSLTKDFGETVQVEYSYRMLMYDWGPYQLEITPMGLVTLEHNGKTEDCVEVKYLVLSTDDGKPADFANCLCATSVIDEELEGVAHGVWYTDKSMTEVDVHGTLDIGVEYTFYIPIKYGFEESGLAYVVVSDRDGVYQRLGNTYWYSVDPTTAVNQTPTF